MKTKMRTIVFLGSAVLMLGLLVTDVYSSWYEWTKAAREKLEWKAAEVDCRIKVEFEANYDPSFSITLYGIDVGVDSDLKYRFELGKRIICVDGSEYKDCSDILGFWESWDGEGDCIPKGAVASQSGID